MKKKKTANLIMVLIIATIVVAGVVTAFMLKTSTGDGLGSQYQIRELKDNAVITPGQEDHVCTITIVCDTILDNTNNLNEEKAPFVPRNGTILPKTRVSFVEGDTVFEVLNKVCEAADIQIEYSWTPMYNSYYIEGINHLYEFDCGPESGWMYKVDEWFPNYGWYTSLAGSARGCRFSSRSCCGSFPESVGRRGKSISPKRALAGAAIKAIFSGGLSTACGCSPC